MWLVIAEKPSVAKAIKEAMPGQVEVTNCFGHLFDPAPPDESRGPRRPTYRSDIGAAMRIETRLLVESGTFCIQSAVHSVSTWCIHRHRSPNFESAL
jgi:DNA topoisomerase IA